MNKKSILLFFILGLFFGVGGDRLAIKLSPAKQIVKSPAAEEKFASGVTGQGFYKDGNFYRLVLSDGRSVVAEAFRETPTGWQAKVGDLWYIGER